MRSRVNAPAAGIHDPSGFPPTAYREGAGRIDALPVRARNMRKIGSSRVPYAHMLLRPGCKYVSTPIPLYAYLLPSPGPLSLTTKLYGLRSLIRDITMYNRAHGTFAEAKFQ